MDFLQHLMLCCMVSVNYLTEIEDLLPPLAKLALMPLQDEHSKFCKINDEIRAWSARSNCEVRDETSE